MKERRLFCNGFLVGSVSTKVLLEITGNGFLLRENIKKIKKKKKIEEKQSRLTFGLVVVVL